MIATYVGYVILSTSQIPTMGGVNDSIAYGNDLSWRNLPRSRRSPLRNVHGVRRRYRTSRFKKVRRGQLFSMDPQIVEVRTWSEGVMWQLSIVLRAGRYRSQDISLVPLLI